MNNIQFNSRRNILHKLCQFLGILAPSTNLYSYRLYSIGLTVAFATGSLYCETGNGCVHRNHILKFTQQLANIFLNLTSEGTIIWTIFIRKEQFGTLIKNLEKKLQTDTRILDKYFWIYLLLVHILILLSTTLNMYIWGTIIGCRLCYVVRQMHYYHYCIIIFVIFWFIIEISYQFTLLNKLLNHMVSRFPVCKVIFNAKKHTEIWKRADVEKLQYLMNLHLKICDTVEIFNSLFGTCILGGVLFIIAFLIQTTVTIIYYCFVDVELEYYKSQLIVSHTFSTLQTFVSLLIICLDQ